MPDRLDAPIAFKEISAVDSGRHAQAGRVIGDSIKPTYRIFYHGRQTIIRSSPIEFLKIPKFIKGNAGA